MPEQFVALYAYTLALCERLMADVSQEEMERQPAPGVNPPAWIVGHLAICTDYALQFLGQPKRLPESWHAEFGPASSPLSEKHPYPSKEELLTALRSGHAAVVASLPSADPQVLAGPNPLVSMPFVMQTLPTVGDLLAHLISTHEAVHMGSLSNWRRQTGRAATF